MVTALVAAVALVAVVFAFSPFNPMRMLPGAEKDEVVPAAAEPQPSYSESAYASDRVAVSEEDAAVLGQVVVNGSAADDGFIAQVASSNESYTSQVGVALLNEIGLPSGCEIAALDVLLQSMGYDISPFDLADRYLVMDGSFSTGYAGSPYGAGGGFPPGIVNTASAYLSDIGSAQRAYDLTGTSFEGLKGLLDHGYPVLVWGTMFNEEPMFSGAFENGVEWYDNEHCVVVYGVSDEGVLVSDSLDGYVARDEATFERIFNECGCMAAAVV